MSFKGRYFLLFTITFLAENPIRAQDTIIPKSITKKDTAVPVDSSRFYYFLADNFEGGNIETRSLIETRLDGFQNYHSRQANLGNAGSPEKQLRLPVSRFTAFSRGPNYFSWFGFQPGNSIFYDSGLPYTKAQLILGIRQEQNVQIIHAHPFGKNCNIAFGFDRVRSEGFYRRQNTNNSNLDLNGWYRSPGRKYSVLGNVFWNGSNIAQNGGIKDDALFESATQFDRQLVAINLSSASTRQRMRGISIKQYRSFGPVTDTLSEKSDSTAFRSQIRPHWAIAHSVEFLDESYVFEDNLPSSGFYENIFLDSNQTLDSTYLWRIENGLWLEKFRAGRKGFSGRIGGRYEAGEIINDTIYRHFTNIYIDGRVSYITRNVGDAFINAWYAIEGFNKGDYKIQAEIRTIKSGLIFEQSTLSPEFVFTNYSGNHFRWQNDFGKSDITAAKIYFVPFTSKFNLLIASFQWNSYYRPVYFNEFLMPEQYYATVNAFAVRIRLDLGKEHFRTKSFLTWNRLPEGSPIRLPEFIIRESFYLNYKLFKSALLLQAGIDLTWFSSYFADAYNPNVAQFYVQDSKAIGSYVYLDAWVSMKIKSVRVFIKADHLNAGWFGRTYYLTPHYPYPDFALKFGIAWVFND